MSDSSDRVRNVTEQVLADDHYVLRKASFELQRRDAPGSATSARRMTAATARRSSSTIPTATPSC
jgi:hypothetical protein